VGKAIIFIGLFIVATGLVVQYAPWAINWFGQRIANEADKRGLIVRPIVHLNIMSPPLTMTKPDVDFVVRTLRESVMAALATLEKDGFWPPEKG